MSKQFCLRLKNLQLSLFNSQFLMYFWSNLKNIYMAGKKIFLNMQFVCAFIHRIIFYSKLKWYFTSNDWKYEIRFENFFFSKTKNFIHYFISQIQFLSIFLKLYTQLEDTKTRKMFIPHPIRLTYLWRFASLAC